MKKVIAIISVLAFIALMSVSVNYVNNKVEKQKEKIDKYAKIIEDDLKNLNIEDLENIISPMEKPGEVNCENEYLTENKELVLNNCTINEDTTKYCYYKDTVYKCSSKKFKDLYSKLDKDKLTEVK